MLTTHYRIIDLIFYFSTATDIFHFLSVQIQWTLAAPSEKNVC